MKNLLTATMPALALLALGGCATSGALTTSTETDGVYYSSSDRTTAVASPAPTAYGYGSSGTIPARALDDTTPTNAATTDNANPDYQGGTTQGYATTGTDYYSNTYNDGLTYYNPSGFNQPYTGPGVSSYNYSPAYAASPSYYGSPYGYSSAFGLGYSPLGFGYSPFGYGYGSAFGYGYPYGGGGFYDPFYSPFGYGPGISIGFGYGFGGFGGYPYGYGSPFGYGYGSPFGYGYGSPYGYGYGGYGRGYYADGGYGRQVIYTRGAGVNSPGTNAVLYGSRTNRGGAVMNANAAGNPRSVNAGNGGMGNGNGRGSYTGNATTMPSPSATGTMPGMADRPTGRGGRSVSFGDATGQPTYSTPGGGGGNAPQSTASPAPNAGGSRGRGFFSGFFGNPNGGQPTNAAGQPANAGNPGNYGGARQRSSGGYDQQAAQGGYSRPQRSYSQPAYNNQPARSFERPTYSQPSQPAPSFGGGSFGGGGGGGGGRGRR